MGSRYIIGWWMGSAWQVQRHARPTRSVKILLYLTNARTHAMASSNTFRALKGRLRLPSQPVKEYVYGKASRTFCRSKPSVYTDIPLVISFTSPPTTLLICFPAPLFSYCRVRTADNGTSYNSARSAQADLILLQVTEMLIHAFSV